MQYFYLISSVFLVASTNIIGTFFNRRNESKKDITPLYNFLLLCAVFSWWTILFLTDRTLDLAVIPYAVGFAVCYTLCNIGLINALKTGSVMLTSLFCQLSLILVSVWGFFFWSEEFTWVTGLGLALTAIALYLCLYTGKSEKGSKLSFKWLFFALLALIGNAGCSIVQRTQQISFDGKYGNFLMFVATGVSAVVFLMTFLRSDKRDAKTVVKTSWYFPVLAGLSNALLNLFVIFMATSTLSPSLIYPTLAVGSLIVVTLFSLFVFKEKMRWWQWIGVVLGVVATGILSL